jgi:phosphoglycolate phosphatase
MIFKLIVFDWDGTLMDSEAHIVACMQAAVGDVGISPVSRALVRDVIGLGLREAVHRLLPGIGSEIQERVAERYRHHFLEVDKTPSELFPGVPEVLEWLEMQGYLLAVATGKGRRGLDEVLDSTGLGRRFHATRCADETQSKPHPAMLLELMDQLGARPRETLMVGDTEYDLLMAQNAGACGLAVGYGTQDPDRLLKHRPLACIEDLRELRKWLTGGTAAVFGGEADLPTADGASPRTQVALS